MTMSEVRNRVQDAVDRLVETGAERGVQVAVYQHGTLVADAVAGVADPATGRPVTPDTLFYNFSIGKGATAAVAHVLAGRGLFGYDTPVVELWPEFGAHGKHTVTVRHVLTHSAGVPAVPADTTAADLCDWDRMCAALADAELWWEPGTKVGYHSYTFGYLVGEIVRRATGTPISEVLRAEVAGPIGVADELYFGVPASQRGRLATLEDAPGGGDAMAGLSRDLPMFRATPPAVLPTAALGNRADVLAADIPAGGKTSARAIARLYAALLGEVDGVRLLSPDRFREATAVTATGVDEIFGNPSSWALGWAVGLPWSTPEQTPGAFGMAGAGGSFAFADTRSGIAFGLTKNRLTGDFATAFGIGRLVVDALAP
jgi:CubicO group peptidase (beta-lactamase class C family)